jgi:hypothetical protein
MRAHLGFTSFVVGAVAALYIAEPAHAVDGTTLIDQNRALAGNITPGDAAGFPVTISRGGSYRLSGNLTVPDVLTTAISIETGEPVSLDLNGFSIIGPHTGGPRSCQAVTPGKGVGTGAANSNTVEIKNGTIRGMGCEGILLIGFANSVQNMRVRGNGGTGIQVSGLIANNTISANGGEGISTFNAVITGNHIDFNEAQGIVSFAGVVSNNVVVNNGAVGLFVPGNSGNPGTSVGYSNNTFIGNNGGGAQTFGGIQLGANLCGPNTLAGTLCP